MERHRREIAAIASSGEEATFANTVAALDYSGRLLDRVYAVFSVLHGADTNPVRQQVAETIAPELAAHWDAIWMNAPLFERVDAVFRRRHDLNLSAEQRRLLEEVHRRFVRGGALLPPEKKKELAEINQRLSALGVQFEAHLLEATNAFALYVTDPADVAGLPKGVLQTAREAAAQEGKQGWKFTVHKPVWIPFMQYAANRTLRKRMWEAYVQRGMQPGATDNRPIALEMVRLRARRAALLGYADHAAYALEDAMAGSAQRVFALLDRLWPPALAAARREAAALQKYIDTHEPEPFPLAAWDWFYYAEKVRKEQYDLDENEIRQYFLLPAVQQGAFALAEKLFGLQFVARDDVPTYAPDVQVFEVRDGDGGHRALLYVDYFPRDGKQQGAWMTEFRTQRIDPDGTFVHPVIVNVFNFPRPSGDRPALLSFEEAETLFHEFGHALHAMMSQVTYPSLAGTNVARDFVELPSQFMENWLYEKPVLRLFARHWQDGAPIPDDLVERMQRAATFNMGFATAEYLAASYLDMAWHTLAADAAVQDVDRFERALFDRLELPAQIPPRYHTGYFSHIFPWGYSAGYYSYVWSEVLDADAFAAFKERGLFDPEIAASYRDNILSTGNTAPPVELYRRFRGSDPDERHLLRRRGLIPEDESPGDQ